MTIDIIMPCYYSNDIIKPAFEKIAQQTKINNITLIIVNDCSPNTNCNYQDLIQEYKDKIKIRYFKTQTNIGPGKTRQLGLDNATSDFITFLDDDDELYSDTTIEEMLNQVQGLNINNIISISGSIQVNYLDQKIETWPPKILSTQGTLYNRKLLQQLNIHFEPILSFKEEDGCFCSLASIKSQQYQKLIIQKPVYIRKILNNHISVVARTNEIGSILAMISLKCFPLLYLYQNNIQEKNVYMYYIEDAIAFVPNLFQTLLNNLQIKNYKLTVQQFKQLNFMLSTYSFILNFYNINYTEINFNNLYYMCQGIFNQNNFYGDFNKSLITVFENYYPSQLLYIKNNFIK